MIECGFVLAMLWNVQYAYPQESSARADRQTFLSAITAELRKGWPDNHTVNIVCHGHSVPAGYFVTPEVRSLEAYPHLLRVGLAEQYPHAVINVIVTAIGGENSQSGATRFIEDVISHRPDIVTIDYGLNDRNIGLKKARKAWQSMIEEAQSRDIKVFLMTPTADLTARLDDPQDPLNQHAEQIRGLAREYKTGLVDSLDAFQRFVRAGGELSSVMSQSNHPNGAGHKLVAERLLEWFPTDGVTKGPQHVTGRQ